MRERRDQVVAGLIFVLAVIVLAAGVLWLKNVRLGGKVNRVRVEFSSTSGLVKGDPVEASGVSSGEVRDIRYEQGHAIVILDVDRGVEFYPGTRIVLENMGMMGQKHIAIYPGPRGAPLPDSTLFHGEYQPGITELMDRLGATLENVQRLSGRLEDAMDVVMKPSGSSFSRVVQNLDSLTAALAGSRRDLAESVRGFDQVMNDLHHAIGGHREEIDGMIVSASRSAARFDTTLVRFNRVAIRLDSLLAMTQEGRGSLGRAVKDPALYEEMQKTLRDVREFVDDIRTNPKKYVKLSLF